MSCLHKEDLNQKLEMILKLAVTLEPIHKHLAGLIVNLLNRL
jgi:hypothetical protein